MLGRDQWRAALRQRTRMVTIGLSRLGVYREDEDKGQTIPLADVFDILQVGSRTENSYLLPKELKTRTNGHIGVERKEWVDGLAKQNSSTLAWGPKPYVGISQRKVSQHLNNCVSERMKFSRSQMEVCRKAKDVILDHRGSLVAVTKSAGEKASWTFYIYGFFQKQKLIR